MDFNLKSHAHNIIEGEVIIIGGPTAGGKSAFATDLARDIYEKFNKKSVIINGDSQQMFKDLGILTALPMDLKTKPRVDEDFNIPIKDYAYALYAINEAYVLPNLCSWYALACKIIDACFSKNFVPLVVGGSGFYLQALMRGMPSVDAVSVEIKNYVDSLPKELLFEQVRLFNKNITQADVYRQKRALAIKLQHGIENINLCPLTPPYAHRFFYVNKDRDSIWGVIAKRLLQMFNLYNDNIKNITVPWNKNNLTKGLSHFLLNHGLLKNTMLDYQFKDLYPIIAKPNVVSEVFDFFYRENKHSTLNSLPITRVLGVESILNFIDNKITLGKCLDEIFINTRKYAKRQQTWFCRY